MGDHLLDTRPDDACRVPLNLTVSLDLSVSSDRTLSTGEGRGTGDGCAPTSDRAGSSRLFCEFGEYRFWGVLRDGSDEEPNRFMK